MSVAVLLDAAGRQRSPATLPGHHAGRAPGNKRRRYPVHAIADAGSAIGRCDGGGAVVVGWWGSVGRVKAGAREWELDVRAPEARPIFAQVPRAVAQTEALNRLPYADQDAIRAAWAELTNSDPDPTFRLIPPVYSDQGINIRVGRDVFINHNCTLNDIGGITIGDEVFIGPRVSLISSGHPIDPARRRTHIRGGPIVIERGVWLCAGATVLQGVTVGEHTVVAAGAVVTSDVPAGVVAGGVPAKVLRPVAADDRA